MANYKLPCDEQGCCPPYPPHPEPHPTPVTILNCGTGSGISLPVENNGLSGGGGYGFVPQVVGTVNIDTSRLQDINKKIEFSSIINFRAEGFFSFTVVFQLSAICNGGGKQPLGTWTFDRQVGFDYEPSAQANGPFELDFDFKDPFGFTWCECGECPECCRFIVEVVDVRSCGVECASITNVSISAMAVGLPNHRY
ncbi:MAG: DUF4489 domain-containing protein [Syntrophomonas sp.]